VTNNQACPCGAKQDYLHCCGRYIEGQETAPTAEALMRSRYTAYTLQNEPYLLKTWHDSTRPDTLAMAQDQFIKWTGLTIKHTERGGEQDNEGIVEFVARYKLNGKAQKIHEVSQFEKHNGQWLYVNEKAG